MPRGLLVVADVHDLALDAGALHSVHDVDVGCHEDHQRDEVDDDAVEPVDDEEGVRVPEVRRGELVGEPANVRHLVPDLEGKEAGDVDHADEHQNDTDLDEGSSTIALGLGPQRVVHKEEAVDC